MRTNIKIFVKSCSNIFNPPDPIFEIGSLQVPGQEIYADLRLFFKDKIYVGCDLREGFGVDRIEDVQNLSERDEKIGTIIIIDTLEHVQNPFKAMHEIYRVIKKNGMVIITSTQNFPIHNYPMDYWRFTSEAFNLLLEKFSMRIIGTQGYLANPHTIFGIGFKQKINNDIFNNFLTYFLKELSEQSQQINWKLKIFKKTISLPLIKRYIPLIFQSYAFEEISFTLYKDNKRIKSYKTQLKI